MSEKTQLTRITVPAITDARYIEGMDDAFDKINDNFKKIASLPFLQGVQGDSYQLEEYKIWNDDWSITEDGKVLLDSIFGKDVTVGGSYFDNIRNYIGEFLDDVSPLDFFVTEDGNTIINNSLYFYVIKDDTGNVIEKQLGQYYYFVDGRLKNIGNVYNGDVTGVSLDVFNDYTGFYQYKYNPKSYNQTYLKVEILPSIYYDQDKNDICWKFNGNETGISAIGVKGADGKDADLLIVRVSAKENDCTGLVNAIINPIGGNTAKEDDQWIKDSSYFKVGKALICIQNESGDPQDFAYGQVIQAGSAFNAYWEPNYNFSKLIGNNRITNYFYNMGDDDTQTSPFYLAIPSSYNRGASGTTVDKQKAHVLRGSSQGDDSLNLFHSNSAFDSEGNQVKGANTTGSSIKEFNIENYNVNIKENLKVQSNAIINGSLDVDGNVKISSTTDSLGTDSGALVVKGGIGITKNVNVGGKIVGDNGIKIKNGNESGIEFYSGTGATTDTNYLKVDSTSVTVGGGLGRLNVKDRVVVNSIGTYAVSNGGLKSGTVYYGIKDLIDGKEGNIHCGGTSDMNGTNTAYRTVYNRSALQAYHQKLEGGTQSYAGSTFYINPNGGPVLIGRDVTGKSSNLTVNGYGTITGSLRVGGTALFSNPVTISSTLAVNGTANFSKPVTMKSTLGVTGSATFSDTASFGKAVTMYSTLGVTGAATMNSNLTVAGQSTLTGKVSIKAGVGSTNTTTGSLVVTGGVGISEKLHVGSSTTIDGVTTIENSQKSSDTGSGALVVTGGVGIGGAANIGGKITGEKGIKITNGNANGIEFYSGAGSTKDTNYLKVDSNGVFVSGDAGKLVLNGTRRQLLIGSLASNNTFNAGIDINNTNDNTSTILFKGANTDNTAFANQMCITTNATRGTNSTNTYTVGRFYMDNNFDKQYIQIFTGYDSSNPIYGNSKAGIQILHDKNDGTVDRVDIKPKLSVAGPITGSSGITITGEGRITGFAAGNYLSYLGGTGGPGLYITGGSGSLPTAVGGTGGVGGTGAIITGGTSGLRGSNNGGVGILAIGGKGNSSYGPAIRTRGNIQIGDTSGNNLTTLSSTSDCLSISRDIKAAGNLTVKKLISNEISSFTYVKTHYGVSCWAGNDNWNSNSIEVIFECDSNSNENRTLWLSNSSGSCIKSRVWYTVIVKLKNVGTKDKTQKVNVGIKYGGSDEKTYNISSHTVSPFKTDDNYSWSMFTCMLMSFNTLLVIPITTNAINVHKSD
jgi:hypothetical protein